MAMFLPEFACNYLLLWLGWSSKSGKIYNLYLIILNHWVKNRPYILQFLWSICKWINDVYIEHRNSIMALIILSSVCSQADQNLTIFAWLLYLERLEDPPSIDFLEKCIPAQSQALLMSTLRICHFCTKFGLY